MMNFEKARKEKEMKKRSTVIKIISGICIVVLLVSVFGRESLKRKLKTLLSDYNGGLNRTVTVYDINGNITQSYTGKFDVEYDSDRIIFDDENGKRHMIFIKTGQVFIDEN